MKSKEILVSLEHALNNAGLATDALVQQLMARDRDVKLLEASLNAANQCARSMESSIAEFMVKLKKWELEGEQGVTNYREAAAERFTILARKAQEVARRLTALTKMVKGSGLLTPAVESGGKYKDILLTLESKFTGMVAATGEVEKGLLGKDKEALAKSMKIAKQMAGFTQMEMKVTGDEVLKCEKELGKDSPVAKAIQSQYYEIRVKFEGAKKRLAEAIKKAEVVLQADLVIHTEKN